MHLNIKKIAFVFLFLLTLLYAHKIKVQKGNMNSRIRKTSIVEQKFSGPNRQKSRTLSSPRLGENLLVMLVDFQEDDDPLTTGNGKFLTESDSLYPISVGKPPHDRNYFELQIAALRTYYNSVSFGEYNLDFTVMPRDSAYTLPHEMSYYHPNTTNGDLKTERFEEYFHDVITTVDKDQHIVFSNYDHFMVIHAGSEWQHDVLGDTPCDLPSFFLRIGTGKEEWVDDSTKVVTHFCNVPEMTSQDFTTTEQNGTSFIDGYGAVNAVYAHEFGHSLGLPDLYNVFNFSPSVGYWDIMDSGGSAELTLEADAGIYSIEGPIPAFPGAWSRAFLWNDYFRERGFLKDITEFDLSEPIELFAATRRPGTHEVLGKNQAYIVKIPINEDEYFLIENRQTDHDKDGPTSLVTADEPDSARRVILFPAGFDDAFNTADEYDFSLPGWVDDQTLAYGGGLVIWRVNDRIMFREGITDGDEFQSNFDANRINIYTKYRGVQIVEADGLFDLGNASSLYWNGTVYEPFYKFKPDLDAYGNFTGWSLDLFNPRFNPSTTPAFEDENGIPIMFDLYDIDSDHYYDPLRVAPEIVSFRFKSYLFDNTYTVDTDNIVPLKIGCSSNTNNNTEIPVVTENGVNFLQFNDGSFEDIYGDIDYGFTHKYAPAAIPENGNQYVACSTNELFLINDYRIEHQTTLNSTLQQQPVPVLLNNELFIAAFLEDGLTLYNHDFTETLLENVQDVKYLSYYENNLYVFFSDNIVMYSLNDGLLELENGQPDLSNNPDIRIGNYKPVVYIDETNTHRDAIFFQNENGYLYMLKDNKTKMLHDYSNFTTDKPTQIAIGKTVDNMLPAITYGAGNYCFMLDINGTYFERFPLEMYKKTFEPESHVRIIRFNNINWTYLKTDIGEYVAVNPEGYRNKSYSLNWQRSSMYSDHIFWNASSNEMLYTTVIYDGSKPEILVHVKEDVYTDPIIWNGSDANNNVYVNTEVLNPEQSNGKPFVFPNPCSINELRIRIENLNSDAIVKIYDIAGNLIFTQEYSNMNTAYQDLVVDVSGKSSGIYIAHIKYNGKAERLKFSIIR